MLINEEESKFVFEPDEIEREERGGWEDDEDRGHVVDSDPCSDKELDSMFGTLRK